LATLGPRVHQPELIDTYLDLRLRLKDERFRRDPYARPSLQA